MASRTRQALPTLYRGSLPMETSALGKLHGLPPCAEGLATMGKQEEEMKQTHIGRFGTIYPFNPGDIVECTAGDKTRVGVVLKLIGHSSPCNAIVRWTNGEEQQIDCAVLQPGMMKKTFKIPAGVTEITVRYSNPPGCGPLAYVAVGSERRSHRQQEMVDGRVILDFNKDDDCIGVEII